MINTPSNASPQQADHERALSDQIESAAFHPMPSAEPGQAGPEREILTIADVASLLGVSRRTVERYVEESRIPFFRLQRGRRGPVRFLRSQLLQWLGRITVKPSRHGTP